MRFGIVDAPTAERWLDGFNALHAEGNFVLTLQYFGAAGLKSAAEGRSARRRQA